MIGLNHMKKINSNPKGKWQWEEERNIRIYKLHESGLSFNQISRMPEIDITPQRLQQICRKVLNKIKRKEIQI
jgi:hypothetical protein